MLDLVRPTINVSPGISDSMAEASIALYHATYFTRHRSLGGLRLGQPTVAAAFSKNNLEDSWSMAWRSKVITATDQC